MTRLLSVGNALVDVVAQVPALPARGSDTVATRTVTAVGGGGFNTLVAAARHGLPGGYAGGHGIGPCGDRVRAALAREGLTVLLDPVPGADTGWTLALVEPSGERTFVTTPGAEVALPPGAYDRVRPDPGDLVHVSGYALQREPQASALAAWLDALPPAVTVLVDPGPLAAAAPPEVLATLRGRADWWSATDAEAAAVPPAARRGALVRHGSMGCTLRRPGRSPERLPGHPVRAVDANGAGDTHAGVFLAGLAAGLDPRAAAVRANVAAALSVTRRGPATAPTSAEVDAVQRAAG